MESKDFLVMLLVVGALCLFMWSLSFLVSGDDQTRVTCVTHGATLLSKNTKDGKYLTFWCIKNGKVVP